MVSSHFRTFYKCNGSLQALSHRTLTNDILQAISFIQRQRDTKKTHPWLL